MITLEDIEEIKQLKARYCRCVDLKQWAEFREVFSDDCVFEGTASAALDADAFVQAVASGVAELTSVHHVHNPEIRAISDTRARGAWSLQDYLFWEPGARVPTWLRAGPEQTSVVGFGIYEEEYVRTKLRWRIARTRLSRLALIPLYGNPSPPDGHPILRSVWGEPDREWLAGGGFIADSK